MEISTVSLSSDIGLKADADIPSRRRLARLAGYLVAASLLWLALKDWLLSDVQNYPYLPSCALSAAFLVCGAAAFYVRRCSIWRDLMIAAGLAVCILIASGQFLSLSAAGVMPSAAVFAAALALPGGIARKRAGWERVRDILRAVAGLFALVTLVRYSGLNNSSQLGGAAIAVTAIATAVALRLSLASQLRYSRIVIVALYAGCAVFFGMLLIPGQIAGGAAGLLIGHGIAFTVGSGNGDTMRARVLAEQGLISIAMVFALLLAALAVDARSLAGRSSQEAQPASALDDSDALSSAAITTLLCMLVCAPFSDGFLLSGTVPGFWVFGLCTASLVIASRRNAAFKRAPASTQRGMGTARRLAVYAAGALLVVLLAAGALRIAANHAIAAAEGLADSSSSDLPTVLIAAAKSQSSAMESPGELHIVVRHALGCRVNVIHPSLALLLAGRMAGIHSSSSGAAEIFAGLLACGISRIASRNEIIGLFLKTLDYGVPPGGSPSAGPEAAALYYFHVPLSQITPNEARFLASASYMAGMPDFRFKRAGREPRFEPLAARAFVCDDLAMPVPGSVWIHHEGGLSNSGEVAASSVGANSVNYPFVREVGKERLLPGLHGDNATAVCINDRGEAAGWSAGHAVIWDRTGVIHDLGVLPGFTGSVARGINNLGQVVGYCSNSAEANGRAGTSGSALTQQSHAFLWDHGRMQDLGIAPGCEASRAYAINDYGQVAGWVLTRDGKTHAMVWEDGAMHDIGALADGSISIATAINDAGQVVGSCDHTNGTVTAFLWQNGIMHDLGLLPGSTHSKAYSINNLGQIAGVSISGVDYNGGGQIFLWDGKDGMRDPIALHQVYQPDEGRLTDNCMAFALNDQEQLLGLTYYAEWRRMFVLTPDSRPADFSLSATSPQVSASPGAHAWSTVQIKRQGGFCGSVQLAAQGAPPGLKVGFGPARAIDMSIVSFDPGPATPPGTYSVALSGEAGGKRYASKIAVLVKPARAGCMPVDLSSIFNVHGICSDGTASLKGGVDNQGFTYSASLLGSSVSEDGIPFRFGPSNGLNAAHDVTVPLPPGSCSELRMLASAVNGRQDAQSFMVTYSDGSKTTFRQSISDWASPSHQSGETIVSGMPYRNRGDGTQDQYTPVNIYGYRFSLNPAKTVRRLTLPLNGNLRMFAVTLVR